MTSSGERLSENRLDGGRGDGSFGCWALASADLLARTRCSSAWLLASTSFVHMLTNCANHRLTPVSRCQQNTRFSTTRDSVNGCGIWETSFEDVYPWNYRVLGASAEIGRGVGSPSDSQFVPGPRPLCKPYPVDYSPPLLPRLLSFAPRSTLQKENSQTASSNDIGYYCDERKLAVQPKDLGTDILRARGFGEKGGHGPLFRCGGGCRRKVQLSPLWKSMELRPSQVRRCHVESRRVGVRLDSIGPVPATAEVRNECAIRRAFAAPC